MPPTCPKADVPARPCAHRRPARRSVELRPNAGVGAASFERRRGRADAGRPYCFHQLDLRRRGSEIFRRFHHSSTQRAVRRAEREGLTYEMRDVGAIAREFLPAAADDAAAARLAAAAARLVSQPADVSRRPRVDPRGEQGRPADRQHPDAVVQEDDATTSTAARMRRIIAWAACRSCSGASFRTRARAGSRMLDLGRSDVDQPGLIAFKDHLGATQSTLTYYRYPKRAPRPPQRAG